MLPDKVFDSPLPSLLQPRAHLPRLLHHQPLAGHTEHSSCVMSLWLDIQNVPLLRLHFLISTTGWTGVKSKLFFIAFFFILFFFSSTFSLFLLSYFVSSLDFNFFICSACEQRRTADHILLMAYRHEHIIHTEVISNHLGVAQDRIGGMTPYQSL